MRFLTRSLTGLLLLAVTLGILGLVAIVIGGALRPTEGEEGHARPAEERVIAANVMRLTSSEVTPVLSAYGKVETRRALELRARQSGTVVWVADAFRSGLAVTEGEVLVRLDPIPAEEALALARADRQEAEAAAAEAAAAVTLASDDLAAAEAQLDLRQQALDRQRQVEARGAGSAQAVETAELAFSAAEQAVLSRRQALAAAKAGVNQSAVAVTRAGIALSAAERVLAETEIRAGFSGRADAVTVSPGAVVTANEVLGRLIDPNGLDIAVRLSTAQVGLLVQADGSLAAGRVTVRLPANGVALPGRVDRMGASVGDGQTGRLVYVALEGEDPAALLQPGDFVEVAIEEAALPDAALLPATALGRDGTLLALGPEDRLQEVPVELLRRQGDDVIIRVGPLQGREVVAERSSFLGEGIRIRPIRPGAEVTDATPGDPMDG
jgi:multidrug efflux pump subunit AcrA (membrane-fusion protein)